MLLLWAVENLLSLVIVVLCLSQHFSNSAESQVLASKSSVV